MLSLVKLGLVKLDLVKSSLVKLSFVKPVHTSIAVQVGDTSGAEITDSSGKMEMTISKV